MTGVRDVIGDIDPTLVDNEFIFPSDETLSQVQIFMPLPPERQAKYEIQFQQIIGN